MAIGKNKLGLWSIVLLGVNSILGTGIFLLPGKAMDLVGPASIFVYLLVTLIAIAIAFCFAECASMFSRNGAAYVYAKEAFGDFIGFEVGIMKYFVSIVAWAALAVGFSTALEQVWPAASLEPCHSLLLVGLIGGLAIINILGIQKVELLNNLITLGKLIPLLFFILVGALYMEMHNFIPLPSQEIELNSFGAATLLIFFAFSGFESLAIASEEMENPKRNIPLAIFYVLLITSLIYVLVQTVVVGILGPTLATAPVPIAAAAEIIIGPTGKWLVMICMLFASGGTNIAASFIAPRSGVALAQDGVFPPSLATYGRFGTPTIAIVLTAILTLLVALSGSFVKLAIISVITRFVQYFPTCLAVLVFRRTRPDLASGFPRIFGPTIPLLAMICIGWLVWNAALDELVIGLGGLVVGVPLFFLQKNLNFAKESRLV